MEEKTAHFRRKDNSTIHEAYDILVGADGMRSRVRSSLEASDPSFKVQANPLCLRYKSIRDLPEPVDSGKKHGT